MLDRTARRLAAPLLDRIAAALDRLDVSPSAVTGGGLLLGLGACTAAALSAWPLALALWLANRLADGIDGPLARRRGVTDLGGVLDLLADFAVYAGFIVGVAVAVPAARLAAVVLLATYYVSGAALLAWSAVAERRRRERPDERTLHFAGGLAEGTETIVAYVAVCLFPAAAPGLLWAFAALVGVTAVQRVAFVRAALRPDGTS